jgi:hypothetical protein
MADLRLHQLRAPVASLQNAYAEMVSQGNSGGGSDYVGWDSWDNFRVTSPVPVLLDQPKQQPVLLPSTYEPYSVSYTDENGSGSIPASAVAAAAIPLESEIPWPVERVDTEVPIVQEPQVATVLVTVPIEAAKVEVEAEAVPTPSPVPMPGTPITAPSEAKKAGVVESSLTPIVEPPTERVRSRKPKPKATVPEAPTEAPTTTTESPKVATDPTLSPSFSAIIVSWVLTAMHCVASAYELVNYKCIDWVNELFVNAKWKWVAALAMDGEDIIVYSYINKYRKWPLWYRIFRQLFALFMGVVFAVTLFIFLILPNVSIAANLVVGAEIQQVYMDTPLLPHYVKDYVHDFINTETFESIRLARIKNRENAMEDAETDAEREALETYDQLDHDGDGTYTRYEMKSFSDVSHASGSGMQDLEDSFWGNTRHPNDRPIQRNVNLEPVQQIRVEPIMPVPLLMCDLQPQYYRMRTNIVLRKGCFDMQQYALDMTYNPRWLCKQLQAKEVRAEAQKQGRAYVGMLDERIAACRQQEKEALEREVGIDEQACVCNAHYGLPQLSVYSSTPGREPIYLIEPKIVPMNYSDFTQHGAETAVDDKDGEINPFDHMQVLTMWEDEKTALGKIDKILYEQLNLNPDVRQPRNQILVDAYVLASRDTMREFYGDVYGPSVTAFLDARSILMQGVKEAEKRNVGGQLNAMLNQVGHYFKQKLETDTEATSHESINVLVMQTRAKIESLKRKALLAENVTETGSTVEQAWGTLASLVGGHYETKNAAERRRLMELETPSLRKKTNLAIPSPHSICVIKCIRMHDAMMLERQKMFDRTVTHVKVDSYTLPELNFVTRK